MEDSQRRLLWHGMFLFLMGLMTGILVLLGQFANPRMGLAAHLEAMANATFLVALGGIWPRLQLTPLQRAVAYWGFIYSTYANWGFTSLGAALGTGGLSTFAAPGRTAEPYQERIVIWGLISVGVAIVPAVILVLWGLRRPAKT